MHFPEDLRYSKDHIWLKAENEFAIIGITFFAQLELGEVAFVQLKPVEKHLSRGKVFGTIEALKTVSDIFMPVGGTITEINKLLVNDPGLVNKDSYAAGWLVKIKPDNMADPGTLLSAAEYELFVNG